LTKRDKLDNRKEPFRSVHHFKYICSFGKIRLAAFLGLLMLFSTGISPAPGQENEPEPETRIGVANVERLLSQYWRTPNVRDGLERRKVSEEYRQKQMEVARLEQELSDQPFWFFSRKREIDEQKVREKRNELEVIAAKEAEKVRGHEGEAIDELMVDIKRATEAAAQRRQLSIVFDSNSPHILFLNLNAGNNSDITDEVMQMLNVTKSD
jgi:Skp family chaperone for outer membrane proteins